MGLKQFNKKNPENPEKNLCFLSIFFFFKNLLSTLNNFNCKLFMFYKMFEIIRCLSRKRGEVIKNA